MSNKPLPTARELIKTIKPDKSNFDYCSEKGVINGSLLIDIESKMEEYADLKFKELREENDKLRKALDHIVDTQYAKNRSLASLNIAIQDGKRLLETLKGE